MTRKIFISYHSNDREFVVNLTHALEKKALTIWARDVHGVVGKRMDHQIQEAIEESDVVLFILSQSSVVSKELMDEVHASLNDRKTFIPLLIEPCELPKRLKRIQFIDLNTDRSVGIANLFRALALKGHNFSELHRDVMALLTEGEQKLLVKKELARSKFEAIEKRNRNRRLLLLTVASVVVGILAYITWGYNKKDRDHFNKIDEDFNLYGIHSKDTIDLIEKRFTEHGYDFAYCGHKRVISNILNDYQFDSTDGGAEAVPNYQLEIDRLKAVIDSLQLNKVESNKKP
ncbi:toll/interleukin-1 receptor domain-containing protein [uncultured Kriegella sp.]|uniref:toll/interleukin-1 receptor domain-containing protein n=1 Tax=uncultured Kriegella sp. TaxID=1798910 RepID=UPI0030D7FD2C